VAGSVQPLDAGVADLNVVASAAEFLKAEVSLPWAVFNGWRQRAVLF
jgi:hypothetical protein